MISQLRRVNTITIFHTSGRYDYRLMAGFTIDTEDIGTLEVTAAGSNFTDGKLCLGV